MKQQDKQEAKKKKNEDEEIEKEREIYIILPRYMHQTLEEHCIGFQWILLFCQYLVHEAEIELEIRLSIQRTQILEAG